MNSRDAQHEPSNDFSPLEDLFHDALALDPDQREAFIEANAPTDEIARDLRHLLRGHAEAAPDFIEPPEEEPPDLAGVRIGDFLVTRLIATGGMGDVYEATQSTPERTVALKMLRTTVRSKVARRRFAFEQDALARLRHPGIARIHAAGEHEGTPWFAMEFIPDAKPITEHAMGRSIPGIIDLFLRLCDAIDDAHRAGVIHRDLKPSNVLVDPSTGEIRVIDFGIARLEDADVTVEGGFVGTLNHMAPEQTESAHVDSRVDVYALGVLLYRILTGHLPCDVTDLPVSEAIRRIREDPPTRPSRHRRDLKGDLDAILLHALEKDPERRYASVASFAEDLRRHLAHEPIRATRASMRHRAELFVRRHRVGVGAAIVVALALVGATIASTLFALDAKRSAALARDAASRATTAREVEAAQRRAQQRISTFLTEMLASAQPSAALGRDTTVRDLLPGARTLAMHDLADDPLAQGSVLLTLGSTYRTLGDFETARELAERASVLVRDDPETAALARSELGWTMCEQGDPASLDVLRDAIRRLDEFDAVRADEARLRLANAIAEFSTDWQASLDVLSTLRSDVEDVRIESLLVRGQTLGNANRLQDADLAYTEAMSRARAILPEVHPTIARIANNHANILFNLNRIDDAEALWTESLEIFETTLPSDHPRLATVVYNLALVAERRRDLDLAEMRLRRTIEMRRTSFGADSPALVLPLTQLGWLYRDTGRLDEASSVMTECVMIARDAHRRGEMRDDECARALAAAAMVFMDRDDHARAIEMVDEVVTLNTNAFGPRSDRVAGALAMRAVMRLGQGEVGAALDDARRSWSIRDALAPNAWLTANSRSILGECLLRQGMLDEARLHLRLAGEVLLDALGPAHPRAKDHLRRALLLAETEGDQIEAERLRTLLGE